MNNQKLIAITGGIASGKSSVADILESEGFTIIRSDQVAKELIARNDTLITKIKEEFGDAFYKDGIVNKNYVSELIFGDSDKNINNRKKLDALVHPAVIENNLAEIEKLFSNGEEIVFVESALTFEAKLENGFDYIICVYVDEEIAKQRLIDRNNLNAFEAEKRLNSQLSPEYKKGMSDFVIDNSKSLSDLKKSTLDLLDLIKILPAKNPDEKDN